MYPTATQAYRYQGATDAVYMGGYPLRGLAGTKAGLGLAMPDGLLDNVTANMGVGAGAALGMVGAGLYGGVIGGVVTQGWKGALTGGLTAAAISGLTTGAGLAMLRMFVPAAIVLGLGGTAAYFTWKRTWGK